SHNPPTTQPYPLSLHDALPISTARFADIGDDFNVDVDAVRAAVTPKTRAIMPVHLYGQTADMPQLADLARQVDVAVIEDAAQAQDRKSTRLNSSHSQISYAVFC